MTDLTSHTRRRNLHPLGQCAYCGSRSGLYTTYLLTTRSMAAVCEDPVACLRRKGQKR